MGCGPLLIGSRWCELMPIRHTERSRREREGVQDARLDDLRPLTWQWQERSGVKDRPTWSTSGSADLVQLRWPEKPSGAVGRVA